MKKLKKISICIGCYNEEKNIPVIVKEIRTEMFKLEKYDYEIIFADNDSLDSSQEILRELASKDKRIKVIINNRNFGGRRSLINCLKHATGDLILSIVCDLQTPTALIPVFVDWWEKGYLVVFGQKVQSRESRIKYCLRTIYYKIIASFSDVEQYEHASGIAIYDKSVIDEMNRIGEVMSYAHLVAELGYEVKLVPYTQEKRKNGKSSYSISRYFDYALTSLVTTSTVPLRLATVLGSITSAISFFLGIIYLFMKLIYWGRFTAGTAPLIIGMFFLGSVQLMFIGIVGEYVGAILKKISKIPLVVEKELINFDE